MNGSPLRRSRALPIALCLLAGAPALLLAASPAPVTPVTAAPVPAPAGGAQLEALAASFYPAGGPGAAILVSRGGEVLLEKGFGLANLELAVPMAADNVLRLGSVTKQFTAVAILMLAEQGKLRLDQTIAELLPDYPQPQGGKVRIEHLLSHTGGLPNYTDDPEFWKIASQPIDPPQMLALFAGKPLEFEPGERFAYSNSGYWVLGLIVEKVSGESYRSFVEQHLFQAAGMASSLYDDPEKLVPRRAAGYQPLPDGSYAPSPYIHLSGPFAAGALASTVADLRRWYEALLEGRLIKKETLEKAWTPFKLNGGKSSPYGFGWNIGEYQGRRLVSHGGGVPGFTARLYFLPAERIVVAVLSNGFLTDPNLLAQRLVMAALGERGFERIALPAGQLAKFEGVYRVDEKSRRVVRAVGDHLTTSRDGRPALEAWPISATEFVYAENNDRLAFELDGEGRVKGMRMRRFDGGEEDLAPLTGEKVPEAPKFIELAAADLDRLAGDYELHPGFVLNVRREAAGLVIQATGQGPIGAKAISATEFLAPEIGARLVFQLDGGRAESLIFFQGGGETPARRID